MQYIFHMDTLEGYSAVSKIQCELELIIQLDLKSADKF